MHVRSNYLANPSKDSSPCWHMFTLGSNFYEEEEMKDIYNNNS